MVIERFGEPTQIINQENYIEYSLLISSLRSYNPDILILENLENFLLIKE